MFTLNPPSFSLNPFLLVLSLLKSLSLPILCFPFIYHIEQPQSGLPTGVSSPGSAAPALPAFPPSRGVPALGSLLRPPLAPLPQLQLCPVLRAPELDAGLPGGSQQSGAERQKPLPHPPAHASFDAAQDTTSFLGCEHTLPACEVWQLSFSGIFPLYVIRFSLYTMCLLPLLFSLYTSKRNLAFLFSNAFQEAQDNHSLPWASSRLNDSNSLSHHTLLLPVHLGSQLLDSLKVCH